MTTPLDDLTKLLGLLQTPSRELAKQWANETRKLIAQGKPEGAAAITVAEKMFPAEFVRTKFDHTRTPTIRDLLDSIDQLV
jgi:hypothetical protein